MVFRRNLIRSLGAIFLGVNAYNIFKPALAAKQYKIEEDTICKSEDLVINHEPVIKGENASGELVEVSGPNCEKVKQRADGAKIEWRLVTRKDIKAGDELTLEYTFYKI